MMPEPDENEPGDNFFQIMLFGALFTTSQQEDRKKNLQRFFQECGVTLNNSDFMILDHSRIGKSSITIARYTLDYMYNGDTTTKKRVCVEGSVSMETDERGNQHIVMTSKNEPFMVNYDPAHSEASLIRDKI